MPSTIEIERARARFPRGLEQPEGSFRFSVDALLLAAFASATSGARARSFADLGTGCGVVGLALCLLHPALTGQGIEMLPQAAAAASRNAALLGLSDRFQAVDRDLAEYAPTAGVDLVVANPPWRKLGAGRLPKKNLRVNALVDKGDVLPVFCAAAARLLRARGSFACVYDAERLPDLLENLRSQRLEPKRLRFVHARANDPARIVLLEARKNSRPGLRVEEPLFLYSERDAEHGPRDLTQEARIFCPLLPSKKELQ